MAPPRQGRSYRFAAGINEWYEKNASPTGGGLEWVVQVVTDLLSEIVDRTPVRSGRAKANWLVGLGTQPRGTRRLYNKDGDQTVRAGLLVLQSMRFVEPTIFIVNNLPYALRLERGSSKQAPYGMVALGLEAIGQRYGVSGAGLGQYISTGRERGREGPPLLRRVA